MSLFVSSTSFELARSTKDDSIDVRPVDIEYYAYGGIDPSSIQNWMLQYGSDRNRRLALVSLWLRRGAAGAYGVGIFAMYVSACLLFAMTPSAVQINWEVAIPLFIFLAFCVGLISWTTYTTVQHLSSAIRGSKQQYLRLGNKDWDEAPHQVQMLTRCFAHGNLRAWLQGRDIDEQAFEEVRIAFDLFLLEQIDLDMATDAIAASVAASNRRRDEQATEDWASAEARAVYLAAQAADRARIISLY